jgi:Protein of unknown function (DUF3558)
VNGAVRTVVCIVCAAGLSAITGCGGDSTVGEPVAKDPPGQTRTGQETGDQPSSPSRSPESSYSVADLCGLLSVEEVERLGAAGEGTVGYSMKDGHEQCRWDDETQLVIGLQPNGRSKNAPTGAGITNTPVEIDGLTAVQSAATEPIISCQLLVDLPTSGLISLSAAPLSSGVGKYEPCDVAKQMADLVVPRVKD